MTFELHSILLLIVTFQFGLMGIFLLTNKKGKRLSNLLLGTFCLTLSMNMCIMFVTLNGHYKLPGLFSFIDLVLFLLYGPLIFFYCKSVIYRNFQLRGGELAHLLPFFLMIVVVSINYVITPEQQKLEALEKIYTHRLTVQQAMVVVPFYLHIVVYMVLSFRQISIYKKAISENFSDLQPYSLNWLNFLIKSFLAITLISMMLSIFPYTQLKGLTAYALAADVILTFFIINQIVFKALRQPDLFSGIDSQKKYSKSNLTSEAKDKGYQALENLMKDERPYLDADLSLSTLANLLNMRDRDISQIINECANSSFHDYVNAMRIHHAKRIMEQTEDPKLTILEILYQSGFNSKSSFNTAFRKHAGLTPTEYRRSLADK